MKIGNYLNDNLNHLDYACGPGTLIGNFSNSKSIGVDISSKQIHYAIKNYEKNGNFLAINDFNFKDYDQYFDIITVLGLIEFLNDKDVAKLIERLKFTLKDDGKIILTTPNFSGITKILEVLQNKFGNVNYEDQHINKFTKNKLIKLFGSTTILN